MQHYKSLCVEGMIYGNLVNIHTQMDSFLPVTLLAQLVR